MKIILNPQRLDQTLALIRAGDVLTFNGVSLDFSPLPEGATLPAAATGCEWIVGPVRRLSGQLELSIILPHGANPSQAVAFPEPIHVTEDGPVALPFDPPVELPEEPDA